MELLLLRQLRLAVFLATVFSLSLLPVSTSPAPYTTSPAPIATSPAKDASSPALVPTPPAPVSNSPASSATSSPPQNASSPAPASTSPAPVSNSPEPSANSSPQDASSPATASTSPAPVTTTTQKDDDDCYDDFEYQNNPELLDRLKKYDVAKVLETLGGAPGKVNVTWRDREDVPESAAELEEGTQHLADNANSTYWLYQYASTDYEKYIRLEHALLRAKGTADEHVDVRGEVWWAPEEGLCGALRHARYRQDGRGGGFVAEVLQAHCHIFRKSQSLSCYGPDSENPCAFCISGVSGALIATLVG